MDSTTGQHAGFDGEAAIVIQVSANGQQLLAGIAGYGSDEFKVLNPTTGALVWVKVLPGDCQGLGIVGTTYVVGYHRNQANGTIPYPYFSAQLEASNRAADRLGPEADRQPGATPTAATTGCRPSTPTRSSTGSSWPVRSRPATAPPEVAGGVLVGGRVEPTADGFFHLVGART